MPPNSTPYQFDTTQLKRNKKENWKWWSVEANARFASWCRKLPAAIGALLCHFMVDIITLNAMVYIADPYGLWAIVLSCPLEGIPRPRATFPLLPLNHKRFKIGIFISLRVPKFISIPIWYHTTEKKQKMWNVAAKYGVKLTVVQPVRAMMVNMPTMTGCRFFLLTLDPVWSYPDKYPRSTRCQSS